MIDNLPNLRAILKHELCHILTIPTMEVRLPVCPDGPRFFSQAAFEYIDIFREYLADVEFNRRFPNEQRLYLEYKKKVFRPDAVLADLEKISERFNGYEACFAFFVAQFRILYDAIYFYVTKDNTFLNWCKAVNQEGLYQLFLYIMEDMEYIEGKKIPYFEKLVLVRDSMRLVLNVDIENLLRNQISFIQDIYGANLDSGIISLWKYRKISVVQ